MVGLGVGLVRQYSAGGGSVGGGGGGAWLLESATLLAPKYWLTEDGGRWLTE